MHEKGTCDFLQLVRCFCPILTHRYILVNLLSTKFRARSKSDFARHAGHLIYITHHVTCVNGNFLETGYVRNGEEVKAPTKVYEDRFRKQ